MCVEHCENRDYIFSFVHGTIMKIDHKENISNSHKIKILQMNISDHNATKVEI